MHAHAIARPHWKTVSAVLLAGAILFAAQTAHAEPRQGKQSTDQRASGKQQSRNQNNHSTRTQHSRGPSKHSGNKHYSDNRSHHRGGYSNRHSSRSVLSLNFGSGYYSRPYYGRPYYGPTYYAPSYYPATYYPPAPVVYNAAPVTYTSELAPTDDGRYCREYTAQVMVGGRMQESYGQACLQPDGAWELES